MEKEYDGRIAIMRDQIPPFVWPEQRVLAGIANYDRCPPFDHLIDTAMGIMGLVAELDERGINWVRGVLTRRPVLKMNLVLLLYPACATRQGHLEEMSALCKQVGSRFSLKLFLLRYVEDISMQSLLINPENGGCPYLLLGPVGNFGFGSTIRSDRVNFVTPGESSMVESWTRWFNWMWATQTVGFRSDISDIPDLVRPEGSEAAQRRWDDYVSRCSKLVASSLNVAVDPETGDVVVVPTSQELEGKSPEEQERIKAEQQKRLPSVSIGVAKLDPAGDEIARLFQYGEQATIDKSTRIKPLSAPISPRLFGEEAERREGRLEKKISYRVEIFEEKDQKRIDNLISSIRGVLNVFSYPLADGVRWVPLSAKELLKEELKARNSEGIALLKNLVHGNAEEYFKGIEPTIRKDANAMYKALFPDREMSDLDFLKIKKEILVRLEGGLKGEIIPKLTFSPVGFHAPTTKEGESSWGPAYSLLLGIAKYPREAVANGIYFQRNFKQIKVDDVFKAMNILNDPFYADSKRMSDWAWVKKEELPRLLKIEEATVDTQYKCRALLHLIKTGNWDEALDKVKKET